VFAAIDHVQLAIPVGGEDEARQFWCGLMGFIELPKPESLAKRGGPGSKMARSKYMSASRPRLSPLGKPTRHFERATSTASPSF
jgi:hypothetical protein